MKIEEELYSIRTLAKKANVNIQTIRFYERIKILFPKQRMASKRIRYYDGQSLETLYFIKNSQNLGFQLEEIKELIRLRIVSSKRCNDVKDMARKKLTAVQEKIRSLQLIEQELHNLISGCSDKKGEFDCPIINKLENRKDS